MSKFWTRGAVLGAMALVGSVALAGQAAAQGTLAKVKAAGVLKIGIADNIPWSKLNPDGSLSGIAPQQVLAVAKAMGIPKVEAIVVTYGQLVPGLMAGRWDMIGASLTISPERCEQVLFSDPFYRADEPQWIGYLPGSLKELPKSFVEIAQRFEKVGMTTGAQLPFMQTAITKANSKMEIVQFGDPQTLIEGLTTKRVPLVTADQKTMELMKSQRGGFEISPVDSGQPNRGSGGAFRKEDKDFRDAFAAEQKKLRASGDVKKILAEYNYVYDEKFMDISGDNACKL